ncbi:hypothetical protein [Streptomyces sp. NPDC040750]|uniref:hypothetical protein n=1 Tax=Streptomyces sp. NPDC040750 TaxID=3154491 RepID=UPI0033EFBE75
MSARHGEDLVARRLAPGTSPAPGHRSRSRFTVIGNLAAPVADRYRGGTARISTGADA